MTPLIFDLIIGALVILSLAIGFLRGFCNEVFTIFGWIAAVIATIYFTPVLLPFGHKLIEKEWLARLATSSAIFLVTLAVCSAISYIATRTLHASKLGMVDRIMGFGFGALRAIVLLGLGYLLFTYVFKEDNRPEYVTKSHSKPFLEASAEWIQTIVPLNTTLGVNEAAEVPDTKPKQSIPPQQNTGEHTLTTPPPATPVTPVEKPHE
jgi:membrane protein required for colicin V production